MKKLWFDIPIPINELCEAIASECDPEQVFDYNVLAQWALDNGFIEKES